MVAAAVKSMFRLTSRSAGANPELTSLQHPRAENSRIAQVRAPSLDNVRDAEVEISSSDQGHHLCDGLPSSATGIQL